jgi:hypothetical protein
MLMIELINGDRHRYRRDTLPLTIAMAHRGWGGGGGQNLVDASQPKVLRKFYEKF